MMGTLVAAAALSACNGDDVDENAAATPPAKSACGSATVGNADMRCPPGFTQPKS
ncbi:hypothetical protein [Paraburkholderia caledonica]|uniref:Lipoprotein n=1 Tax=Paraburkholderia caledonica TaxID=134536 RepID=A0AB73IQA6_9BURK|nr:hypothetical protein [Paraburkholderia caledonica]